LAAAGATWILRSLPVDVTAGEVRRLATTAPAEVGGR